MIIIGCGLAGDDVEVVDDGGTAEVEEVLAGSAVAGAAALPVADVGEGVLNLNAFAEFGPVPCHNSHTGSELVFSVLVRLLSGTR